MFYPLTDNSRDTDGPYPYNEVKTACTRHGSIRLAFLEFGEKCLKHDSRPSSDHAFRIHGDFEVMDAAMRNADMIAMLIPRGDQHTAEQGAVNWRIGK